MARDLQSLEMEIGKFSSEMDDAAGKVFDHMDAVRAKAGDVFKRTHDRVDAHGKTVDRVDALISNLDRSNQNPTLPGSSNGSGHSSETTNEPDSAEKKR